jgi:adenylate kinase
MKLIIFGPQGCGKGTQAEKLAARLGICHITMGDILREEVKSQSELGKKIESIINQGNLVPDDLALDLLTKKLSGADCSKGFVLDGYPRNIAQAKFLDEIVKLDYALEINLPDEESIQRISGRRTCSNCGYVYHLKYNPPKNEEVCDKDGSKLIIRNDDQPEVIKKRLAVYHNETEPIRGYYEQQGIYLAVDGLPPIPEVTQEIFSKLGI